MMDGLLAEGQAYGRLTITCGQAEPVRQWLDNSLGNIHTMTCRDIIDRFNDEALPRANLNTMRGLCMVVCIPETTRLMDEECRYAIAYATAKEQMCASFLMAAYDKSLPPDIRRRCLKHYDVDLTNLVRRNSPHWVSHW
jgi:hypothetical protein